MLLHRSKINGGVPAPGPEGPKHLESHGRPIWIAHSAPPAALSNLGQFSPAVQKPSPEFSHYRSAFAIAAREPQLERAGRRARDYPAQQVRESQRFVR
jgi:hypothetical protein